jgi:alpha-L-fucosidase
MKQKRFDPTWESLQTYRCPDWFRDAKFGIWAHWGPQAVPMTGDWYARNMYNEGHEQYLHQCRVYGHPSKVGYKDLVHLWKADKFDPASLVALYKKAGARYVYCCGVHHDNFDCWNSKHHRWNSVMVGPKKDIVGLFAEAVRAGGLKFGVSEHLERAWCWLNTCRGADCSGPLAGVPYDGNDPAYEDLYLPPRHETSFAYPEHAPESWMRHWRHRMVDLIDQYQPDLFYTDGAVPFGEIGLEVMAHFYNRNLERDGELTAVYAIKDHRHFDTPLGEYREGIGVLDVERGVVPGIHENPWQTDTCIGDWYYKSTATYKTPGEIISLLIDIVSKNGNLLLNLPPHPDGFLDDQEIWIAEQIGAWLAVNGEGIYATRPYLCFGEGATQLSTGAFAESQRKVFTAEDFRFTKRDHADGSKEVFVFMMKWPDDGVVHIKTLAFEHESSPIRSVKLLGAGAPCAWGRTGGKLTVQLPVVDPGPYPRALRVVVG